MIYDIVINGSGRVGKDTFVKFVAETTDAKVINISSIDPFRDVPMMFGWDGEKDDNYRQCLKLLKEASTYIDDYPIRQLILKRQTIISQLLESNEDLIIFYHIREPEEIDKLEVELPDIITICLQDGKDVPSYEKCVLDYFYDYIIMNDSTLEDLKLSAIAFIEDIKN